MQSERETGTEEFVDFDMRGELVRIVVDALRKQGHPTLTWDSVRTDPAHRDAFVAMLGECRPLPVVLKLRDDVAAGRA
jgi:hypothetical protein